MSGTDELRDLLNRLKDEVGPLADSRPGQEPGRGPARPAAVRPPPERLSRPYRSEARLEERPSPHLQSPAWRENKEMTLFGMLASLTAALGGILAGLDYLVLTGTVLFALFSAVMLLALFGYKRDAAGRGGDPGGLNERLDTLSGKVSSLGARSALPAAGGRAFAGTGKDELERKVEELYALFKNLSKTVERRD